MSFVTGGCNVKSISGAIEITLPEPARAEIFTIDGKHILDASCGSGSNIVALNRGFYIVKIGNHTTKILVE